MSKYFLGKSLGFPALSDLQQDSAANQTQTDRIGDKAGIDQQQAAGNTEKPLIPGHVTQQVTFQSCVPMAQDLVVDIPAIIIVGALTAAMFGYKAWRKKKLSPIMLIVLSALLGLLVY